MPLHDRQAVRAAVGLVVASPAAGPSQGRGTDHRRARGTGVWRCSLRFTASSRASSRCWRAVTALISLLFIVDETAEALCAFFGCLAAAALFAFSAGGAFGSAEAHRTATHELEIGLALAERPDTTSETFLTLIDGGPPRVRLAVASSTSQTAAAAQMELARDSDLDVRVTLAANVSTTDAVFEILAQDPSIEVRRVVVENPAVPHPIAATAAS